MNELFSNPKITTIIPTFRRPELLKRAIKSVLNQTYPHFQVCIYDNASGDETAAVVEEFMKNDARVKYHCHAKNIGGESFKYGINKITTPYFSILSDDDLLMPEFYKIAKQSFEKYPEAMFSVTRTITIDTSGNIKGLTPHDWNSGVYNPPEGCIKLAKSGDILWTGVLFRKEVLSENFLDDRFGNISDLNCLLSCAAKYPFVVLSEPGAIFTSSPSTISGLGRYDIEQYKKFEKVIDNLKNIEEVKPFVGYIEQSLTRLSQRILFFSGIAGIVEKKFSNTYIAADIFSEYYQLKGKALFLKVLANICERFPISSDFLGLIMRTRRSFRRKKNKLGRIEHLLK